MGTLERLMGVRLREILLAPFFVKNPNKMCTEHTNCKHRQHFIEYMKRLLYLTRNYD